MSELDDPVYTIAQLAEACGVTRFAVQRWIEKGALSVIRLPSGKIRIRQSTIDQLNLPRPSSAMRNDR